MLYFAVNNNMVRNGAGCHEMVLEYGECHVIVRDVLNWDVEVCNCVE